MKWLILIVPLLVRKFAHLGGESTHPILEIKKVMAENVLKLLLGLSVSVAIGTLFSTGIVLTILNLATQYDAGLKPVMNAVLASGMVIVLISVIIFAGGLSFANYSRRKKLIQQRNKRLLSESTLTDSLVRLINDFIKEREFKRENVRSNTQSDFTERETYKSSDEFEKH
jgi:hypothetical protein